MGGFGLEFAAGGDYEHPKVVGLDVQQPCTSRRAGSPRRCHPPAKDVEERMPCAMAPGECPALDRWER